MASQIRKQIARALKGQKILGFAPATLTLYTRGSRSVSALAAGTNQTSTDYPCTAMLDATGKFMDGTMVSEGAGKLTVLGGTLPDGIRPKAGSTIARAGITYRVTRVVMDPVEAVYECEVTNS